MSTLNADYFEAVAEMLIWLRKSDGPGFMMINCDESAIGVVIASDMRRILHGIPYRNGFLFT